LGLGVWPPPPNPQTPIPNPQEYLRTYISSNILFIYFYYL
jgi:hypothetical protein